MKKAEGGRRNERRRTVVIEPVGDTSHDKLLSGDQRRTCSSSAGSAGWGWK